MFPLLFNWLFFMELLQVQQVQQKWTSENCWCSTFYCHSSHQNQKPKSTKICKM